MNKIECQISEDIDKCVNKVCETYNWNRAEFNRRAIEELLKKLAFEPSLTEKWLEEGK